MLKETISPFSPFPMGRGLYTPVIQPASIDRNKPEQEKRRHQYLHQI
jgi:hypothetical protein